jgi:hypothetical protein
MRKKGLITIILVLLAIATIPMAVQAQDFEEMPYDPTAATALGMVLNIVGLVIAILIVIFMYKDAEKRGKSGILWAIIGCLCGCIGLIIWLIIRPPIQQAPPPGYYPPPQPGYPPPQPGYPPQQGQYPPPQQPPPY